MLGRPLAAVEGSKREVVESPYWTPVGYVQPVALESGVYPSYSIVGYPCVPREDLLQTGFRRRSRVIFSTWFRPSRKFIDISSSVTRGACLSPACRQV